MAELVLLTLLLLISVTSSTPITTRDTGRCPAKWVKHGRSCYKLITEKLRWHDAQTLCKTLRSSLVNIGSKHEDDLLVKLSHEKGLTVWIGLSDLVEEGQFVWTDTQADPKYTNWSNGQPDNWNGIEDCATVAYDHGGKWNDIDCETKFAAVCEKPTKGVHDDEEEVEEEENVE